MKQLPHIRLRAMEPEDLDMLYGIENDDALWSIGATNVPYSRYVLRDYIANTRSDIYADRQLRLMIEDADGQVVGIIDLVNFDPRHLRAEIGIVICNCHRRLGYATAALQELRRYASDMLHLHQLYAVVDEDNVAALGLFRLAGFSTGKTLSEWLYNGSEYRNAVLMQTFFEKK
jgi:diamine N-acetyltransferase